MSKTQKIIRFTFWINLIWHTILVAGLLGVFLQWSQAYLLLILALVISAYPSLYLPKKYGVKVTNQYDPFYFIQDEREKEIAFRIHSKIFVSYYLIIGFGFVVLTNVFSDGITLEFKIFLATVWCAVALFLPNIQYYLLWNHYDQ
ncbi:hypothetical protein FPFC_014060 [Fructobacillus pseudoficulneus]|uniref:Uncharacterized protein n=1 Tax=Fructobacillus pseudoficulneus TaxID=220714 RepID=A0A3F3H7Z2_9LACO|nr:hypothetical protein [Fructobacillus pseudoficulneus]GAP02523.1 hypothetical protein FPFC_014060 [Fructobacillus pseudoficulneus]SEH37391.1 hypothetical protein SAMN05660469_0474 [Fructobacillus pseudoficulneus]